MAVARPVPVMVTPLRSTNQVTCSVMSLETPLTTPVAMNCWGAEVSPPAAFAVKITDADDGLISSDSSPLIGGGPPMLPPRPVLPPLPVVACGLTPAQPPWAITNASAMPATRVRTARNCLSAFISDSTAVRKSYEKRLYCRGQLNASGAGLDAIGEAGSR